MQPGALLAGHRMRQRGQLLAKLVTVITDEHPHAIWLHAGSDLTCVASKTARMAASTIVLSCEF